MKKILVVITLLSLFSQADSQVTQQWAARKNGPANLGDAAWTTVVDGLGNVYVTGSSAGNGTGDDYSTIKYNAAGVQQWEARYNGPGNSTDLAYHIKVDLSGNVYVTGQSRSGAFSGTEDYATIKYNSSGVQQWVRRYNGPGNSIDNAYNIAVDGSGNVYVTGSSTGSGTDNDYATIKYNSSGDSLWVRRYNGPGNSMDNSYRIAVSDSGNVYVTGYSRSGAGPGTEDCATIKYNSSGVQQWVQRFNNGANEIGVAIAVDASGNVYVAGFAWNGFSYIDCLALKYSPAGVQQWVNILVESGTSVLHSLAFDASGNVYATGYSSGIGVNDDYITVKYNSAGIYQWGKYYNGPGNGADSAYSLALDNLGNVYVTGSSSGSGTGTDYATIKYNSSGVQQWVERYNGPGDSSDIARSVAVDNSGNVYVTGLSRGTGTGDDYATIKYSQTAFSTLNLTAFIEGFYNPASNSMVSDTARLYIRNSSAPYNIVDSSKRKLSSNGTATYTFTNAVNGVNYYLTVKHRNTIETWSKTGVAFSAGLLVYEFSNAANKAYGNNQKQIDASPVKFGLYSGDYNQDGFVNLTDVIGVYNAAGNFVNGYVTTDVNGDNITDLTDVIITNNNSNLFVSKIRP